MMQKPITRSSKQNVSIGFEDITLICFDLYPAINCYTQGVTLTVYKPTRFGLKLVQTVAGSGYVDLGSNLNHAAHVGKALCLMSWCLYVDIIDSLRTEP